MNQTETMTSLAVIRPETNAGRAIDLLMMAVTGLLKSIFGIESATRSNAAPRGHEQDARPPSVAVLIIDVSGSMYDTDWKPSRLAAAKEAAIAFVKRLQQNEPSARVAVVCYADSAKTLCRLTSVQQLSAISKLIQSAELNSAGTNIAAGLSHALRVLKEFRGTSQVVLLTDGQNTGNQDPRLCGGKLRRIAKVQCVGIGGAPSDVDEDLLRSIATKNPDGSTCYRWIGDREQLVRHFEHLAGGLAKE